MFATLAVGLYPKVPARSDPAGGRGDAFVEAMNYLELLRLAAPEAVIVVTALVVLALGLMSGRTTGICSGVAAAGLLFAARGGARAAAQATLFDGMLVITPLISLFKIICLALAFFTVILARSNGAFPHHGEYLALLLLATVGLMLLVGSEELLVIFIGLELTGLSLYVMAAFDKTDVRSAEAGLKYFLFGSTASAFTLFGISLVYGMTRRHQPGRDRREAGADHAAARRGHRHDADRVRLQNRGRAVSSLGAGHLPGRAGSFRRLHRFRFESRVVRRAGKNRAGRLRPGARNAGWHAMVAGWAPLLAALAALSILIGNFVALAQSNVRRLLAYSAVAHAGYTLLGLVAGGREGFSATFFYTTIYAFTLVGAFGVVALVRRETGGDDFVHFAGLRVAFALARGLHGGLHVSLAGIPPLAGFFGKFYLFSAALRVGGNHGLLWLVALALFGSLISFYYYLMVLKVIFVDRDLHALPALKLDLLQRSIAALAGIVLFLGLFPGVWSGKSAVPYR